MGAGGGGVNNRYKEGYGRPLCSKPANFYCSFRLALHIPDCVDKVYPRLVSALSQTDFLPYMLESHLIFAKFGPLSTSPTRVV